VLDFTCGTWSQKNQINKQKQVPMTTPIMPFPTFGGAVRHFMSSITVDEAESAYIVTASNQKWLPEDIEEVFQSPPASLPQ
jgi:hypothetical protein